MSGSQTENQLVEIEKYELTETGEVKLDSVGRPIFKERIVMPTTTGEHRALWTCIKAAIESGIIPEPELDAVFELMEMLAVQEQDTRKEYTIDLPINYFIGLWHCVNTCRKFDLFHDDDKFDKAVDGLAMKLAEYIDMFRAAKRQEGVMEASPNNILKGTFTPPEGKSPTIGLLPEGE